MQIVVKNTVPTLKNVKFGIKKKEILRIKFTRNISSVEARKLVEAPTPIPGISYANITQSSMKKVSVVDTATQTDPITIIDSAVQSSLTNTNRRTAKTKSSNKQCNQKSNKDTYRGEKNRGWPEKSHH